MKRPAPGQPPRSAKEFKKIVVTDLKHLELSDVRRKPNNEGGGHARDLYIMDQDDHCLMIELNAHWAGKLKLSLS
jgi:hypothetical protein